MNKREEFLELLDNAEKAGEEITLAEMRNLLNIAYKARNSESEDLWNRRFKTEEELLRINDYKQAKEAMEAAERLVHDLRDKYRFTGERDFENKSEEQKDFWNGIFWRLDTGILQKQQKNREAKAKKGKKSGKRSKK